MPAPMPDEDKPEGVSSADESGEMRPLAEESGLVPTAPPTTDEVHAKEEDDEANDRPTVAPPFDPAAFARDMLRPSPPKPIPALRVPRADPHTIITPPLGTEAQAAASRPAGQTTAWGTPATPKRPLSPPGGMPGPARRKTPTSTISLANMIAPSLLPPRDQSDVVKKRSEPRKESLSSLNAVDSEWADLEIATRPPPAPADGPEQDPVLEIVRDPAPSFSDLDEDDEPPVETVRRPVPDELIESVRSPKEAKPVISVREMNDRVSLGDYSGALAIAEELLVTEPGNAEVRACADQCRGVLKQMYATRIGPLDRVPVVMVPRDQLRWLSIDHRAGFVLSLVDGVSSLEMIIDVSGMPELDTLRILSELAQQRIISLR